MYRHDMSLHRAMLVNYVVQSCPSRLIMWSSLMAAYLRHEGCRLLWPCSDAGCQPAALTLKQILIQIAFVLSPL